MKQATALVGIGIVLLSGALVGCGKKYSPSCKQAVELTAPWTQFSFPAEDGRVCESSAKNAKFQFISTDRDKHFNAFEQKFLSAGYQKDKCTGDYCVYMKEKASRVQMIGTGDTKNKWVNITVIEQR